MAADPGAAGRGMNLGRVGIWSGELRFMRDREAAHAAAAELEELGYGALWAPGGTGTGAPLFDVVAGLLGAGERLPVITAILSIWVHTAEEAAAGQARLREEFPGRFVLGLGISHPKFVDESARELLSKPRTAMVRYLDALDAHDALDPAQAAQQRILAALRPRMLELARDRSLGSHPYFVTPEHTAAARETLGPGALLAPEQAVVLETDPARAREIARGHMDVYLGLPNYTGNLKSFGFEDADFAGGGSDRLVDAVVAWGDEEAIAARVTAHHEAGADHVAVQVISGRRGEAPLPEWRRLAAALL